MMNVPQIRFKGFTDAWGQCRLGEVFEQTAEFVNPKEDDIELWSLTVENGLTPKTERYNREFLVKKEDAFKAVSPNEFIYNPMNMTLGAVDLNMMDKKVAVSGYYITMLAKEKYDSNYFSVWLKSPKAIKLYKLFATGGLTEKQRVQFPTLSSIQTLIPAYSEQTAIGNFFRTLNNALTLHKRKLEKLKELKKGYLQQMFTQKGENVPRVRFEGFSGEWEVRKLGEILHDVGTGKSKFTSNDKTDANKYAILGSTSIIGYDNNYDYEGDFILTARVGANAGTMYRHKGQVKISDNTVYLQGENLEFMQALLTNLDLTKLSFGTGQPLIKSSELKESITLIPSSAEQTAIGEFFRTLDNLITLHS